MSSKSTLQRGSDTPEKLSLLRNHVLEQLTDKMRDQSIDENCITPPEAAAMCGLHYTYIACAIATKEIKIGIKEVATPQGSKPLVVMSKNDVEDWFNQKGDEAKSKGMSIAEYLSDRYDICVYQQRDPNFHDALPPDLPGDMVPLDIAEQFIGHEKLEEAKASDLKTYDLNGVIMISESDLAAFCDHQAVDPIRVTDLGKECPVEQAAEALSVPVPMIEGAIRRSEVVGSIQENGTVVCDFLDFVRWYNLFYVPEDRGEFRNVLVVNELGVPLNDASDVPRPDLDANLDTLVRIQVRIPNIEQIVSGVTNDAISKAIENGSVFEYGKTLEFAPNILITEAYIELTVRDLTLLLSLAHQGGQSIDAYVALVASGADVVSA